MNPTHVRSGRTGHDEVFCMTREKPKFDVLGKIERERLDRNWTEYTLAKNSGIAQSTISTWYRRQLQPSVASIEKICTGFGITLSEFFENGEDPERPAMTEEQKDLYKGWARLNPSQKRALLDLLRTFDE